MTWAKLDHGFFTEPRMIAVSSAGKLLAVAALCYAGQNLSDGRVPDQAVAMLGAQLAIKRAKAVANELEIAGIWRRVTGGFEIVDYLETQRPAKAVAADREAAKERMHRTRSGNVRANNSRSSGNVRANEPEMFGKCSRVDTDTDVDTDVDAEEETSISEPEASGAVDRFPLPLASGSLISEFSETEKVVEFEHNHDDRDVVLTTRESDRQFRLLLARYPRNGRVQDTARGHWDRLRPTVGLAREIHAGLELQLVPGGPLDTQANDIAFMPTFGSWLRDGRWTDEYTA